ncbi:hypothetical protein PTKU15_85870 [Paraburkholderia terrae]|nr:hypothetical protein PTKU15_85870 [Paraburkholderia terrae]
MRPPGDCVAQTARGSGGTTDAVFLEGAGARIAQRRRHFKECDKPAKWFRVNAEIGTHIFRGYQKRRSASVRYCASMGLPAGRPARADVGVTSPRLHCRIHV